LYCKDEIIAITGVKDQWDLEDRLSVVN